MYLSTLLGNSGNSAISVEGNGLMNAKMTDVKSHEIWGKMWLQGHQVPSDSSAEGLALIFLLRHSF